MPDLLAQDPFTFIVPDFTAGVQTYPIYSKTPVNSLVKARNVFITKSGCLERRPGLAQTLLNAFGADNYYPDIISGGHADTRKLYTLTFNHAGSQLDYTASDGTTGWGVSDDASVSAVPLHGSSLAWGRESDGTEQIYVPIPESGVNARKYNVTASGANPLDNPISQFTNTNTDPPQGATFFLNFLDRMWCAGVSGNDRDKLYYSKVLEPENWDRTTQVIAFEGEAITSIKPFKNNILIIGTDQSIYLLAVGTSTNLLDWEKRRVASDIGIGSHNSVVQARDDVFFLDQDTNVRTLKITLSDLSGSLDSVPVSFNIKDRIDRLNGDAIELVNGAFLDSRYYISGSTTNDILNDDSEFWTFDTILGSWTGPHMLANEDLDSSGGKRVSLLKNVASSLSTSSFFGSRRNTAFVGIGGTVYEFSESVYVDPFIGNKTIPVEIITRPYDFGSPQQNKIMRWVDIEYGDEDTGFSGNGLFKVWARRDFADTWTQIGGVTYDSNTKLVVERFPMKILGRGKTFQIRITDESQTNGPRIRRMWFNGVPENTRDVVDRN